MASSGAGKSVIHYTLSDGRSWGSFLQKKLSEPQYDIPTELHEMGSPWFVTTKYDINIVLVSPDFLLMDSFEKFETFSAKHSLAILLGTSTNEFHDAVSRRNPQSRLLKWICYIPQQTRDSVKGLLLTIINLYESLHGGDEVDDNECCMEDPLFQLVPEPCSDDRSSSGEVKNTDDYDTLPPTRQVNAVHNVIPLPCSEEDKSRELFILLDRKADSDLVLNLESGETIPTEEIDQAVYKARIPKSLIHDHDIKFFTACKDQDLGSIECQFDGQYQHEAKRKNSERSHDNEHSVAVFTNTGNITVSKPSISESTSRLDIIHDILEKETDPVHILCKALRIPDTDHEQLDEYLSRKCRQLRITEYFTDLVTENEPDNDSEWPTLLHFCADTNLLKSTNELLRIPFLVSACLKCNRNQETPRDIAKRNGFTDMVKLLENQHDIGHTMVSRNSDSGILDSTEDSCFPVDPITTSMRNKNGGNGSRDVDSGVSELQHSYASNESDSMDMSPARKAKTSKSVPGVSLSSSVSDLRPSGDYDSITRSWMTKSYQGPANPLPKSFNYLSEGRKEGESTWFVESPPPYRFPVRRSSESDKDSIRLSRNSRKASGSFPSKPQSLSKKISKVFKTKRKTSLSSNPGSTIPEEANSNNDQNTKEDRGGGFPCSPIVSYDDFEEEKEVSVSSKPPEMVGKRSTENDTNTKQKTEEKHDANKRPFKKMKNPFKKKIDRRKSLRMSRVLKDNNVVVLALPSKNDMCV